MKLTKFQTYIIHNIFHQIMNDKSIYNHLIKSHEIRRITYIDQINQIDKKQTLSPVQRNQILDFLLMNYNEPFEYLK